MKVKHSWKVFDFFLASACNVAQHRLALLCGMSVNAVVSFYYLGVRFLRMTIPGLRCVLTDTRHKGESAKQQVSSKLTV